MPFFQMKRIQNAGSMLMGVLLAVCIVAGCVAQKTESAGPLEQNRSQASQPKVEDEAIRMIHTVVVEPSDQHKLTVAIAGNQKLVYTSIKQSFPFGIAVYLPETRLADDIEKVMPENQTIRDITIGYADEEKRTAKVEILLNTDMNYEVMETDNAIMVGLSGAQDEKPVHEQPRMITADVKAAEPEAMEKPVEKLAIPETTAIMTNIEFNTMEDGTSDIVVQTNQPVRYEIDQTRSNKIFLNLFNTVIPDYHKRPLLTRYFKSAVEGLIPVQKGMDKNSRIEITTRQQVPFRVVQGGNTLTLFFEPSSIEPPVFVKAEKKVDSSTTRQMVSSGPDRNNGAAVLEQQETGKEKISEEEMIFGAPKVYTGEKIKLDFYETDIKNVFRILKSVGGLNFAIDKNVTGKVTLSLEDPVPWDQVLDLILKMNNLGQKKEGNVIRIATLQTLKKEETLLQEAIAARKKALEQKKSLEPLVTEYIPINYSDADKDIKPHIAQILTKERGKISVDARTNMIILTDTRAKVDQAKEIIYRLDKVTPQIMIEAKVVEVTKSFSRELGLGLSLSKSQTANTGRSNDFSIALNSPLAAPSHSGSFNFYRILGSDFLSLNAQIAASEAKGDIKVVTQPRILTLDNKAAKIKQGLEYAFLERDSSGGSSVKFKSIDLSLEVTPHVTPDNRIAMTVSLTKNDIDSITNGVPSLSTNEAQTELLVNNNDTIVIGGIVKTTDNESTSGTPYLAGIPILGRLFRTDINTDKRNELLIFLTPSIVQLEQRKNTMSKMN